MISGKTRRARPYRREVAGVGERCLARRPNRLDLRQEDFLGAPNYFIQCFYLRRGLVNRKQ